MRRILITICAGLAFASLSLTTAVTPAQADVAEKDCRGMRNGGSVLIGIAHIINDKIDAVNERDKDSYDQKTKLRAQFKYIERAFMSVKAKYNEPPECGKGDLETDLGQRFPPMKFMG